MAKWIIEWLFMDLGQGCDFAHKLLIQGGPEHSDNKVRKMGGSFV
jgi:hypothetical protein